MTVKPIIDAIKIFQTFPLMCIAPEPMVPKVLINQEFSFNDVTKTVTDIKEYLDDICKKELDNLSKKGDQGNTGFCYLA